MKLLKRISAVLLSMVLLLSIVPMSANAADDTVEISTVEDLKKLSELDSDFSGSKIVLQNDIIVNDGIFSLDENNNPLYNGSSELPESFAPIENFSGTFDGQDYTISGAYIFSEDSAGLFGTCYNAEIKNLNIKNSLIVGNENDDYSCGTGSICGTGYDTKIENCISDAIVIGDTCVGGIIGQHVGSISSCFFKGTVVGKSAVGGVVGHSRGSSMYESGNSGTVYGKYDCGGFAGIFADGRIDTCFNTGDIYGDEVGGFIGYIAVNQSATINNIPFSRINSCYTCGNITAKKYGGFCYSSEGDFSLFFGCYFKGESEEIADYSGNLYKDYMKFCDDMDSMSTMPIIVPDFIFAVDEDRFKLSNKKHLFGCDDYVEDRGNENKGFMIPISLHKVHVWDEYVYNNDATCEKNGTKTAVCSAFSCCEKHTVCDEQHPAMGHSFGEYILNEDGTTETARCQHDGCKKTDTKPHVHTWGEYVYNNDADCTKDGTMTAHCTKDGCQAVNMVADPEHKMTDHSFGEYILDEDGTTETARCQHDGCEETVTKPHVHTWSEYTYNNDADCTKDGTMTAHCTKNGCKAVNTIADPEHKMTDHSFGEWKSNKDAKLFKNETESRVCNTCGFTQTREASRSAIIIVIFDKIINFVVGWFK